MNLSQAIVETMVKQALSEDVGVGDISAALIDSQQIASASLVVREDAVVCGQPWANECFRQLDPDSRLDWRVDEGQLARADSVICQVSGKARALLSAERTALNFLQTLSATATVTRYYQSMLAGTDCKMLDTRKTIPGLRLAQKYAVQCGGGRNHRVGLYDAYLLKENHLAAAGSIARAVEQARLMHPDVLLEVEVESLDELQQALDARVDRVLLDNFSIEQMQQAVQLSQGRMELEASGNIDETNIREIAATGVDFISSGALTKHLRAIDFSMRFD